VKQNARTLQESWKVNRRKAENFIREVERQYRHANPYHNNTHAADVTQTAAMVLRGLTKQIEDFPKVEILALIIAAAVHDLAHPGVNNDFLINSKDNNALIYNDRSVNEMTHVSKAFQIAQHEDRNIFDGLTKDEYKRVGAAHLLPEGGARRLVEVHAVRCRHPRRTC
jgi:calcium/calmodulin-dependent 3',5'-cyclic nucleotide phosphodiesterase